MAKQVASKYFAWDGHRLSRNTMTIQADFTRNMVDSTCYENNAMEEVPGVMVREFTTEGASTADFDFELLQKLAADNVTGAFLVPLWGGAAGVALGADVAVQDARLKRSQILGARDTLSPMNLGFSTVGDWRIGKMFFESVTGSPTGAGTVATNGLELGAAPLGVWLTIEALDIPGITGTSPTLSVTLQSDVDDTFSAPNDLIVNTSITATADGILVYSTDAVTDTWYRVEVTIGGTSSPTYPLLIAAGLIV